MIHSATAVETENFDIPAAPPEPPSPPARHRFPLPAEYYSVPPGDRIPFAPAWAPAGCGGVSIFVLVVAFSFGYMASHGGALSMMNWFIDRSRSDVASMFSKEVTAGQKHEFDVQMAALQQNMAAKRVKLEALQPFLRDMRGAVIDESVTPQEANELILDLQKVNREAKPK